MTVAQHHVIGNCVLLGDAGLAGSTIRLQILLPVLSLEQEIPGSETFDRDPQPPGVLLVAPRQ